MKRPAIPAPAWNRLIDRLAACLPLPGENGNIRWTGSGPCYEGPSLDDFLPHAWRVNVAPSTGGWIATVTPGFLNGIDPVVTVPDPTTGKSKSVPLLDLPKIPLHDFADRSDPSNDLVIPEFFKNLGASVDQTITYDPQTQTTVFGENKSGWRRLKSCDLYLSIARVAVNGSIQITDASGTSGSVAQYVPVFETGNVRRYGTRPRLMQVKNFREQQKLTAAKRILDALTGGGATDFPEDQLLIATVYLLSGPDDNEDYTPYVEHHCWYNLCYSAQNLSNIKSPPGPITIFTGLAGGLGDTIANQILSGINDAASALASGLSSITQEGKFWSV